MGALLTDYGIDTLRLRWRGASTAREIFYARRRGHPEGYSEGARGELYANTSLGRIGVYRDGLMYFEGRASAILHLDSRDHALLDPQDLRSAERVARRWGEQHGLPLDQQPQPATLGRVDLASELIFSNPAEGGAFLYALAQADVPWCSSRVDGRKGFNVETVSFHSTRGHSVQMRAYDKGVESDSHGHGIRIRVERQKRYRKEKELRIDTFLGSDLGRVYMGREFVRLQDLPTAYVSDLRGSLLTLCELDVDWRVIERLAGFLTVGRFLRDEIPPATWSRRLGELRALGIFVDPSKEKRLEVPVGRYLQTLASPWLRAA